MTIMSVGRNDPCPCGRGKKYKKCCLDKQEVKPVNMVWHRVHSMRSGLISKVLKHAVKVYGEVTVHEAWDEFHQHSGALFDSDSPEIPLFMSWFFYNWIPDDEDTEANEGAPLDMPPAQSLLGSKEGRYLETLEKDYVQACLDQPFSFLEITECYPGDGFKLKDIFQGGKFNVIEKKGSELAQKGDIIFGKPVTVEGVTTLEACSPILIPPIHKPHFIEFREFLKKRHGQITPLILYEYQFDLIALYQNYHERMLNPKPPTITNTDGDPMVPQKLIFEIQSPEKTLCALHDLNLEETAEELLETAMYDENGNLKAIEFPWLKRGNKRNGGMLNTVLGHIHIDGKSMTVRVNSKKRGKKFLAELKKRMPEGIHYKSTLIEPIDSMLKETFSNPDKREIPARPQGEEDPMNNAAIKTYMTKMMEDHWKNWVRQKVPALGDKTPIEASKSKLGREILEALLTQFEREAVSHPQPGVTVNTFKKIREQLRL